MKCILFLSGLLAIVSCNQQEKTIAHQSNQLMDSLQINYINPPGLIKNPAFTNVVTVRGGTTIYIGELNSNDEKGNIIGKGDMKQQAEQVFKNLEIAVTAGGGKLENIIKWNIYVAEGQPIQPGFEAFQKTWGKRPNPPLITVLYVKEFANPDYLLGIEAIAVIP